jgi:hypothetical protein
VGLMTRYLLLFDNYGLVLLGALSDERTGLSFIYTAGPHQRSLSRVCYIVLKHEEMDSLLPCGITLY